MRRIIFIFFMILFVMLSARYVKTPGPERIHDAILNEAGPQHVWILFTDKGIFSKSEEDTYIAAHKHLVTQRSIQRRVLRGDNIYDFNDIPVKEKYIKELESMGIEIRQQSKWLNGVSAFLDMEQINAIAQLDFVYSVMPMAVSRKSMELPKTDVKMQKEVMDTVINKYNYGPAGDFQIEQIFVNRLHNMGYTGKGVIIALFDTGVKVRKVEDGDGYYYQGRHKAFDKLNILYTYSFVDDTDYVGMLEITDDELYKVDHGTKMLGLLGGYYSGELISPAFGADYMLFETEDPTQEITSEEDNWIRAAEVADSMGADIISSSLGYKDWYPYSYMTGDSCLITKAANIASSKGIVVVNSIGNITYGIDRPDTSIIAPADGYGVIAVGGVDDYNLFSEISATGPPYDKHLYLADSTINADTLPFDLDTFRIKPDINALAEFPYTVVADDDSAYNFVGGTSGATALISGGIALLLQAHPDWTPLMIKEALQQSSYSPYKSVIDSSLWSMPNDTVGYGIADFYSAVMYADTDEIISIEGDKLLPPYPNPFSSGSMHIPFQLINRVLFLSIKVYTMDGKTVYEAEKTNMLPGVYTGEEAFIWDGMNSEGNPVAPGIYMIMLNSHFEKDFKKISIIK